MAQLTTIEVQEIQAIIEPLKSKRARILVALQMLLKTVTKDRGYTQNMADVTFNVKGWRDKAKAETPVMYIIDSVNNIKRHAGTVREYVWRLEIFGTCREMEFIEFEEFLADVEQCLDDNNTLFGQINKMEVLSIPTDNQLFSELDNSGVRLFSMDIDIEYTRNARNAK